GLQLGVEPSLDFLRARLFEQPATEHDMRSAARNTASHQAIAALHFARGHASRKRGKRPNDAKPLARNFGHLLALADLPPPAAATFAAGLATGSTLLLLFAGGFACDRLAFKASIRLMTLPRSGAAATIGLWPLSFSLIMLISATS